MVLGWVCEGGLHFCDSEVNCSKAESETSRPHTEVGLHDVPLHVGAQMADHRVDAVALVEIVVWFRSKSPHRDGSP